jgi:hypothetical protein
LLHEGELLATGFYASGLEGIGMKSLRITAAALVLLAGLAGLIGCLYLPGNYKTVDGTPRPESQIGSAHGGKPLQLMRATREDVERALGKPSFNARVERGVVYQYEVNTGLWLTLCFGAQSVDESRFLRIQYSPDDRLVNFKVFSDRADAESAVLQ